MQPFKWYWEIFHAKSAQYFSTVLLVMELKQHERAMVLKLQYIYMFSPLEVATTTKVKLDDAIKEDVHG